MSQPRLVRLATDAKADLLKYQVGRWGAIRAIWCRFAY
jgi:hypothetical protein